MTLDRNGADFRAHLLTKLQFEGHGRRRCCANRIVSRANKFPRLIKGAFRYDVRIGGGGGSRKSGCRKDGILNFIV